MCRCEEPSGHDVRTPNLNTRKGQVGTGSSHSKVRQLHVQQGNGKAAARWVGRQASLRSKPCTSAPHGANVLISFQGACQTAAAQAVLEHTHPLMTADFHKNSNRDLMPEQEHVPEVSCGQHSGASGPVACHPPALTSSATPRPANGAAKHSPAHFKPGALPAGTTLVLKMRAEMP